MGCRWSQSVELTYVCHLIVVKRCTVDKLLPFLLWVDAHARLLRLQLFYTPLPLLVQQSNSVMHYRLQQGADSTQGIFV